MTKLKFIWGLVFIVFTGIAYSQTPSPSAGKPSQEPKGESSTNAPPSQTIEKGTEEAPFVVKMVIPNLPATVASNDSQNSKDKSTTNGWLNFWQTVFNGCLVLLTGGLCYSTHKLWIAAKDQSRDTKESVKIAQKSVEAIEKIAITMDTNVRKQSRAYLSVSPSNNWVQNRAANRLFQFQMIVRNSGFTPAHGVNFAVRAAFLDFPLPVNFDFSLPITEHIAQSHLNPGNFQHINAFLDRFLTDAELEEAQGNGRKLYIYGTIRYKDAFDISHHTNFCQWAVWDGSNFSSTFNTDRHNDAS